jgi:hypothetical protein
MKLDRADWYMERITTARKAVGVTETKQVSLEILTEARNGEKIPEQELLNSVSEVVGFRVRLLETEGLSGQVELRTIRTVRDAKVVNMRGETLLTLTPTSTGISFDVGPYEWIELEARY